MATLEALPTELKTEILLNLGHIEDLDALVHASPSFHCAYLGRRRDILSSVLATELSPYILHEAHIISRAVKSGYPENLSFMDDVDQLHEDYRNMREQPSLLITDIPLEDLIFIARLIPAIDCASNDYFDSLPKGQVTVASGEDDERRIEDNTFWRVLLFCVMFDDCDLRLLHGHWLDVPPDIGTLLFNRYLGEPEGKKQVVYACDWAVTSKKFRCELIQWLSEGRV